MSRKANPKSQTEEKASRPIKPRGLTGQRAKFWDLIVPLLHAERYLQKIDRPALELLCDSWVLYQDIQEEMRSDSSDTEDKSGDDKANSGGSKLVTKTDKGNYVQHPLVSARNAAYKQLVGMMVEFGMTPAARVKMTKEPAGNPLQGELPLGHPSPKPKAGEVPEEVRAQMETTGAIGSA